MHFEFSDYFRAAGLTNPGQLRENNEDSFLIDSETGLLVVADGMGGHQSGEIASADAIRVMQEFLLENSIGDPCRDTPHNGSGRTDTTGTAVLLDHPLEDCSGRSRVATAIATANDVINNLNHKHGYSAREAMGTTIVGLYVQPNQPMDATIFHVGDSRFYLFRNGALNQITRDHSAYENWLEDGSKGPAPSIHILSQALGPSESVAPAIQHQTFLPGDVVLLCSDGLTNLVTDSDIEALLNNLDIDDLADGCRSLIDAAQTNGGTDNITVVLGAYSNGRKI